MQSARRESQIPPESGTQEQPSSPRQKVDYLGGGGGEGNEEPLVNGGKDLTGEETKVLGTDSGDGRTQAERT